MRMDNTRDFFSYVLIITLVMICGVGLAMMHGYLIEPDPKPLNATQLQEKLVLQEKWVIPHIQKIFPLLSLFNIGVAVILLMFPLYWVWVAKYSSNLLTPETVPMKPTVYFLILAIGHNTFFKSYLALQTIPFPVFLTMYYPHALLEMLAYILAGAFSLLCIDAVRADIREHGSLQDLHPGELSLFILHRVWYVLIIVGILLVIAGFVECYYTPRLVLDMMNIYYV